MHFLNQHIEGLRSAGFKSVISLDDGLVNPSPALHVIGLHGKKLLKSIGRAIRFECPNLHFSESLSPILRLSSQRLLGDKAIGTDRSGMDLISYEVTKFQHVNLSDHHWLVDRVTCPAIEEITLSSGRAVLAVTDPGKAGTRRLISFSFTSFLGSVTNHFGSINLLGFGHVFPDFVLRNSIENGGGDRKPKGLGCHSEVRFENLPDIHPGRHS